MNLRKRFRFDRRVLLVPPIVIGLFVVFMLARSKKQLPRAETTERAVPIEVLQMTETTIRPFAVGYGIADPKNIWTAVAEVSGRVVEIHPRLRSGNEVDPGDVLLRIDPSDYELRIRQRESDLTQAEAQREELEEGRRIDEESLELQKALLGVREKDWTRLRGLRGNSAASQSESDQAHAVYLQQALSVQALERTIALTPAKIAAAEAAIKLAGARLGEAKRDLERTTIVAPFAGLISGVDLQPQQYLAAGQSLFELHDNRIIEVEAQFSLAQMSRLVTLIDESQKAEASAVGDASGEGAITVDSEIGPRVVTAKGLLSELSATVTVRSGDLAVEFPARPLRATGTIDQQTRTLGIVVEVDSMGQLDEGRSVALRSGAYCEVVLTRELQSVAMTIPRMAARDSSVFVVDEADRLMLKPIKIRGKLGQTLVVEGLAVGDRLVVNPPLDAAAGMLVAPSSALEQPSPAQPDDDLTLKVNP